MKWLEHWLGFDVSPNLVPVRVHPLLQSASGTDWLMAPAVTLFLNLLPMEIGYGHSF